MNYFIYERYSYGCKIVKLKLYLSKLIENNYYKHKIPKDISENNVLDIYFKFPILKKNEIIDNIEVYVSDEFKKCIKDCDIHDLLTEVKTLSSNHHKHFVCGNNVWNIEFTTGSTGKPFPVVKSIKTRVIESLYLLKKRREIFPKASFDNGFLFLHPTNADIASLDLWKFKEEDIAYIVNAWKEHPPKWIFGTPLIFYKYAEYMDKNNCEIFKESPLEFLEYTSQNISCEKMALISKEFNCRIINNYGSREFWNIAYQCRNGNLHINDDYLVVDLVDDSGKIITEYNQTGYVIITHLKNFDMPLFKYYLGDRARIVENNCTCGCRGDIIELVEDREFYKLKNTPFYGNKIFRRVMRGLYFHDYFDDVDNIKIIQDQEFHLTIFVNKKKINDAKFEKCFIDKIRQIVPCFDEFNVDFVYEYPFSNDESHFKEIIFKSMI